MFPFAEWKIWITVGQTGDEVVLPGLDGSFGGVQVMVVRR